MQFSSSAYPEIAGVSLVPKKLSPLNSPLLKSWSHFPVTREETSKIYTFFNECVNNNTPTLMLIKEMWALIIRLCPIIPLTYCPISNCKPNYHPPKRLSIGVQTHTHGWMTPFLPFSIWVTYRISPRIIHTFLPRHLRWEVGAYFAMEHKIVQFFPPTLQMHDWREILWQKGLVF